jgi:hypothetical protein
MGTGASFRREAKGTGASFRGENWLPSPSTVCILAMSDGDDHDSLSRIVDFVNYTIISNSDAMSIAAHEFDRPDGPRRIRQIRHRFQ